MVEYLKEYLKINDVEYKENQKLSMISPIRIGGEAEVVVYPETKEKLVGLISFFKAYGAKYKLVGQMSNILPKDEGYDGIIVKTDKLNKLFFEENSLEVLCGVKLPVLAKLCAEAGLSGLEGLSGIPGQIGGSVRGNAGAFGREISDIISSCTVYSPRLGEIFELSAKDMSFSYRQSRLCSEELILLSARLTLKESDKASVLKETEQCRAARKKTQPTTMPSLGSFFKRTRQGISAARLIDECGLKGFCIGGAKISEKHAGFIVNFDGASFRDVLSLAALAEGRVHEIFSVKLEREVEILD